MPNSPNTPTNPQSSAPPPKFSIANLLAALQNLQAQLNPMDVLKHPYFTTAAGLPRVTPKFQALVNRVNSKPLKVWLEENIHDPYPTAQEVKELCQATGFSHKQVRDW